MNANFQWSIGIYQGATPLQFTSAKGINPVLTVNSVTDIKGYFVADPFMLENGGNWYMFFEVETATGGVIALATSKDAFLWKYKHVVLKEDGIHLSYPYVFARDGEFYMIPDRKGGRGMSEVKLYRATSFPTVWKEESTLVGGQEQLCDCSIVHWSDHWYIFASNGEQGKRFKRVLYHSETLTGPFYEHPASMRRDDPARGRSGGRIIKWNDHLIRYVQDGTRRYGEYVWAIRIEELTAKVCKERNIPVPVLRPTGFGWNCSGMHHIDPWQLDGNGWIACVDGDR